jgi:uncharacterized membrane protein YtjA (UPF0391 family)
MRLGAVFEPGEHESCATLAAEAGAALQGVMIMLYWALVFFVVAIVAAFFGFGGVAAASAGIAKILFFIFLVLFVLSLIAGLIGRRPPAA